eukprot:1159805-Pelagomonas_calceolata.AAC.7
MRLVCSRSSSPCILGPSHATYTSRSPRSSQRSLRPIAVPKAGCKDGSLARLSQPKEVVHTLGSTGLSMSVQQHTQGSHAQQRTLYSAFEAQQMPLHLCSLSRAFVHSKEPFAVPSCTASGSPLMWRTQGFHAQQGALL